MWHTFKCSSWRCLHPCKLSHLSECKLAITFMVSIVCLPVSAIFNLSRFLSDLRLEKSISVKPAHKNCQCRSHPYRSNSTLLSQKTQQWHLLRLLCYTLKYPKNITILPGLVQELARLLASLSWPEDEMNNDTAIHERCWERIFVCTLQALEIVLDPCSCRRCLIYATLASSITRSHLKIQSTLVYTTSSAFGIEEREKQSACQ